MEAPIPASDTRPLVSVVIPNYNHRQYIRAAIDSVLAQTYDNIEIIVVDNFSTDGSWDAITPYAPRGVMAFRFANGGVIAAGRNHGMARASGDLIAFLDSDDTWKPDKLERQIPHFLDPAVALVAATSENVGDIIYARRHRLFRPGQIYRDFSYGEIALANHVATSSVVIRATVLRHLGGFDESRDYCFIEDWELWLRVSRVGRVRVLAAPIIDYRLVVNKDRDTRDVTRRKLLVLAKHRGLGYVDDDVYDRAVGNVFVELGRACLGAGDRAGLRYYAKGIVRSRGARNKLRALLGLSLFALPRRSQRAVIDALYRVQYAVGSRWSR